MRLKVLVIQNNAILNNKNATLENISKLLEQYENKNFDIIVFPEVFSVGWNCKNFIKESETLENSETIDFLKNIALEFKSVVFGGSFIQKMQNGTFRNTCPIISKQGKLITTYDKMHLFSHKGSEENKYITFGDTLKIIDIGSAKIGISICFSTPAGNRPPGTIPSAPARRP